MNMNEDDIFKTPAIELLEAENEKKMLADNIVRNKNRFITDLKLGLGDEIKKNPNGVKIIKKSLIEKFVIWFKNIFTQF